MLAGETSGWLHVLHRVKAGQDVFLVCNQNHQGAARQFKFRATAAGEPECWDAVRNEITAIPFQRTGEKQSGVFAHPGAAGERADRVFAEAAAAALADRSRREARSASPSS